MASKASVKNKSGEYREKENGQRINEQMVLMRDETSQVLMMVDVNKVSTLQKGSKLTPGATVTWQGKSRERWRGPVLAIGEYSHSLTYCMFMNTFRNRI